jgi:hypothetical protein
MDGGGHDGSSLALPYLMFIYVALLIIGAMSLKAVKFLFEFVTQTHRVNSCDRYHVSRLLNFSLSL